MKLSYNDESHAYWLDGKRLTSVTSVAKIPDNRWNLERWNERMVAIGVTLDQTLRETIAAHYDDKDKLDACCEDAKKLAKAHEGRDRGTNVHRITERADLGQYVIPTPLSEGILADYQTVLDIVGLEVIPDFVERIVVYPDEGVAGRFDNLMWWTRPDGTKVLVCVDKKGGESVIRYPHSPAIQIALYVNAPLIAGPIGRSGRTTTFEPLPAELDRETGIILHLPEVGQPCAVAIDIAAGWEIARTVCLPTLRWRKRDDLVRPLAAPAKAPEAFLVDEGRPLTDARMAELKALYETLDKERAVVDAWLAESRTVGRCWAVRGTDGHPSERRYWIARAAMTWAFEPEHNVRIGIGLAMNLSDDVQGTTGAALGSLTIAEAERLYQLASELTFHPDGSVEVADTPLPAA